MNFTRTRQTSPPSNGCFVHLKSNRVRSQTCVPFSCVRFRAAAAASRESVKYLAERRFSKKYCIIVSRETWFLWISHSSAVQNVEGSKIRDPRPDGEPCPVAKCEYLLSVGKIFLGFSVTTGSKLAENRPPVQTGTWSAQHTERVRLGCLCNLLRSRIASLSVGRKKDLKSRFPRESIGCSWALEWSRLRGWCFARTLNPWSSRLWMSVLSMLSLVSFCPCVGRNPSQQHAGSSQVSTDSCHERWWSSVLLELRVRKKRWMIAGCEIRIRCGYGDWLSLV